MCGPGSAAWSAGRRYGHRVRRLLVLLPVLVGVVVGCAQPVPGTPPPSAAGPATSGPATSAAPEVPLPSRPRDVPLDGLDPCTLLTADQRAELGLDQPPVLDVSPSTLYNGGVTQLCSIRGFEPRVISVGVELSISGGVELFFRPGVRSQITPIDVRGFPAVVAVPTSRGGFCTVVVDVAPGQAVDVSAANAGGTPPIPQPELCTVAQRLAGTVMDNLLARR